MTSCLLQDTIQIKNKCSILKGGIIVTAKEKKQAAEAKRNYMRIWRKQNPEKVRAAQTRYWLKVAQKQANNE